MNEIVKFFSPFGVLRVLLLVVQFVATGFCVLGAWAFWPVSWVEQNLVGENWERRVGEVVDGR